MKLYKIEARCDLPCNDNPWIPWYDKTFGYIIRAVSEEAARTIAHEDDGEMPWKDDRYSLCTEITPKGKAEILLEDHHAA